MIRAFIAVELGEGVKSSLADTARILSESGADVRWLKPDRIHLTLVFLGDVTESQAEAAAAVMEDAVRGVTSFSLELDRPGYFGRRGRPRVVWVGLKGDAAALLKLQSDLSGLIQAAGIKLESRPYSPHITLGRVKSQNGSDRLLEMIERCELDGPSIQVESVSLIKSELKPQGPVYTVLSEAPLRPD